MDHQEIEEGNIPDLYLMNKLPSETRLRFEEHFVSCPECLNRLEVTESLRTALKSDLIARPFNAAPAERPVTSFRTHAVAFVAALVLLSVGLTAMVTFRMWREQQRQSVELQTRLAEANASLEQEKSKSAELNDRVAALTQQQSAVPVFPLVITRSAIGSRYLNSVVISQTQNWIILLLELPDVPGIV